MIDSEDGLTLALFRVYHPLQRLWRMPGCDLSVRLSSAAALVLVLAVSASAARRHPGMPRAQRHESRHEIDQLEDTWRDAIIHRNVSAMDNLLGDDYIAITPNGTLQSKDQTLAILRNGTLN